jgi:hypothetical protein
MSLTQEHISEELSKLAEWVTKSDFHDEYPRASYAMMSREIDRGKISIKLDVDGKVKVNTVEATQAFGIID